MGVARAQAVACRLPLSRSSPGHLSWNGDLAVLPTEGLVPGNRVKLIRTNGWLYCWGFHACGIRGDGTRFCWGENGQGQLGLDDTNDRDEPIERHGEGEWSAIRTGYEHSCGIRSGVLWCWGDNDFGQLGIGNTSRKLLPARVAS